MSDRRRTTAEKVAAKKNQARDHVPTSETMEKARDEMGRLTIYMRKTLIEELKQLAWNERTPEHDQSVSKILTELAEERVAAGPRRPGVVVDKDADPDFGV